MNIDSLAFGWICGIGVFCLVCWVVDKYREMRRQRQHAEKPWYYRNSFERSQRWTK